MDTVAFAGDWHGNRVWSTQMLRVLHDQHPDIRTVYHCGDFGLWPGSDGKRYLTHINRLLTEYDLTMYVILGNHEDYDRVAVMRTDPDGWLYIKDYPRLRFAPRGHTWVHAGTRMAAMGGAVSIDRRLRTEHKSWWPQEDITAEDCATLIDNVTQQGWPAIDVMITHEAPAGLERGTGGPRPTWFTEDILHDTWQTRVRLREALDSVGPRWLVHGHWHWLYRDSYDGVRDNGTDYTCEVVGLPNDGLAANLLIAELVPGVGLDLKAVYPPRAGFLR